MKHRFWLHPWKLPTEVLVLWIPSWGKVLYQELWWNFAWVYQLLWLIWRCGLIPTGLGIILLANSLRDLLHEGHRLFWPWKVFSLKCEPDAVRLDRYFQRTDCLLSRQKTDLSLITREIDLSITKTENQVAFKTKLSCLPTVLFVLSIDQTYLPSYFQPNIWSIKDAELFLVLKFLVLIGLSPLSPWNYWVEPLSPWKSMKMSSSFDSFDGLNVAICEDVA